MQIVTNLLLLIVFSFSIAASADQTQDVELADGSVMRAEVIALSDGIYTLRSDSLGEMKIPAVNIKSIGASGRERASSLSPATGKADINRMRESILQDPDAMAKIESLKNDPLVTNILNDEATMRAIQSGDLSALMNDPKVKALMNHSTVQEITQGSGP